MKFKVGDVVVVVKPDWGFKYGSTLTIVDYDYEHGFWRTREALPDSGRDPWKEDEIEHIDVFNSPLFAAMKEEE